MSEAAIGTQFFFFTTTMTAMVAITKINRMVRADAVIIPGSEILRKLQLKFHLSEPGDTIDILLILNLAGEACFT